MAAVMTRDMRGLNAMDDDTKRVHIRLEEWASAVGRDQLNGWPKVTLLGRLIDQGPMGAAQQGKPPVSISDAVAIVDAAVAKLGDIDRQVIRSYYLHADSMEINAKRVRLRVPQFRNVLKRARWRLIGYIDAHDV